MAIKDLLDSVNYVDNYTKLNAENLNKIKKNDEILAGELDKTNTALDNIVQYKCNNSNFLSKIGSDRTLILTEDIFVSHLNLNGYSNLKITSENGKYKIIGLNTSTSYSIQLDNCENIEFDNIHFENSYINYVQSAIIFLHSKLNKIKFTNCYFYTVKGCGFTIGQWLQDDNYINNVTIEKCCFDVGSMCIEILNKTDKIRYVNFKIIDNIFEKWGKNVTTDGEKICVSLVGLSKGNIISNNTFYTHNNNEWCIEINAHKGTIITNNLFIGDCSHSIHTSPVTDTQGQNVFCDSLLIVNNNVISENKNKSAMTLRYIKNSSVIGNVLNILNMTNLSSYNIITNNRLTGNTVTGVVALTGDSIRNTLSNNYIECTSTDVYCRGIYLSGANTTENNSINDTIVLPSTATGNLFFQQLAPTTGNNFTNIISFKK